MSCTKEEGEDDDQASLPGFRFHPTDEELLVFYLKRKVEKKPLRIELIKQVDIYKYEPWDLPKPSIVGENESYFFCKRGRKYKNSIRPNRVTKSGFWKATGIDKPVFPHEGQGHDCIGLKKTLVYYRGSAGKGTKTEWMMHEFRLPSNNNDINSKSSTDKVSSTQEAEVWTICRIFKRIVSQRKLHFPDQSRETATKHLIDHHGHQISSKACKIESNNQGSNYISFDHPAAIEYQQCDDKRSLRWQGSDQGMSSGLTDYQPRKSTIISTSPSFSDPGPGNIVDHEQFYRYGNWDELRSVVDPSLP